MKVAYVGFINNENILMKTVDNKNNKFLFIKQSNIKSLIDDIAEDTYQEDDFYKEIELLISRGVNIIFDCNVIKTEKVNNKYYIVCENGIIYSEFDEVY